MRDLEKLLASNTFITGSIPEELSELANLRVIDLSVNDLPGSIPESIGKATNLRVIDLSTNVLSGSIPESIGKAKSLGKYV